MRLHDIQGGGREHGGFRQGVDWVRRLRIDSIGLRHGEEVDGLGSGIEKRLPGVGAGKEGREIRGYRHSQREPLVFWQRIKTPPSGPGRESRPESWQDGDMDGLGQAVADEG
jgi:hypothetical protein